MTDTVLIVCFFFARPVHRWLMHLQGWRRTFRPRPRSFSDKEWRTRTNNRQGTLKLQSRSKGLWRSRTLCSFPNLKAAD